MNVKIIDIHDPAAPLYITERQIMQEYRVSAYTAGDIAKTCVRYMVYLRDPSGMLVSAFDKTAVQEAYKAEMDRQGMVASAQRAAAMSNSRR